MHLGIYPSFTGVDDVYFYAETCEVGIRTWYFNQFYSQTILIFVENLHIFFQFTDPIILIEQVEQGNVELQSINMVEDMCPLKFMATLESPFLTTEMIQIDYRAFKFVGKFLSIITFDR